ncbi:MAG TPA: hypothetical protein VFE78_11510 [Gemmataceae bacterium]|nr:hypothetical protein [Gemmataceae bacterium]
MAEEYGAEAVLVVNIVYDHAAWRRCYELIAEAFGLPQLSRTASGAGRRTN